MLQKEDIANLTNLQKVDRERLSEVLEAIEYNKIKFPIAKISQALGRDKGEVSVYLNGVKPMSDNFYTTFMKKFTHPKGTPPDSKQADTPPETFYMDTISELSKTSVNLSETNKELAAATKETALANRLLAENQKELIEFLKQSTNSQNSNQIAFSLGVRQLFDKMATAGIQLPGLWKSQEEGLVILDKLLASGVMEMQSSDTRQPEGKQNK